MSINIWPGCLLIFNLRFLQSYIYVYEFRPSLERERKKFHKLDAFPLFEKERSKPSFKDVSKVSKIYRKRFLSFPYFLTRLRMRERQIEIKRISLSLFLGRHTVICPWKIEKRDSYERTISFTNRSLRKPLRERFHGPCNCPESVRWKYDRHWIFKRANLSELNDPFF